MVHNSKVDVKKVVERMIRTQASPLSRDILYSYTESDGSKFSFNCTLDYEVWKAKGQPERQKKLPNHPLVGQFLYNIETSKTYEVQMAYEEWYIGGKFIKFLICCNGSHSIVFWENISCLDYEIVKKCKQNKEKYLVFPTSSIDTW